MGLAVVSVVFMVGVLVCVVTLSFDGVKSGIHVTGHVLPCWSNFHIQFAAALRVGNACPPEHQKKTCKAKQS